MRFMLEGTVPLSVDGHAAVAGTVIGAISASTPSMRASEEHVALMRDEITAATRALSAEFGEPNSQPKAIAN